MTSDDIKPVKRAKNKGGRPRKDAADSRSIGLTQRYTPAEAAYLEATAARAGATLPDWIRAVLLRAARLQNQIYQ